VALLAVVLDFGMTLDDLTGCHDGLDTLPECHRCPT
jgi:hypothetical protein